MPLTRRHRRRLAWLVLFALLLQQVALSAHACARDPAAAPPAAAMAHCAMHDRAAPADPMCAQHCHPDQPPQPDMPLVKLPLLALPPLAFPAAVALQAVPPPAMPAPRAAVDPPPRSRFCSLLI